MSLFGRIFGNGSKSQPRRGKALTEALANYPASAPPHLGPPRRLSEQQAEENLAHLLSSMDDRIAAVLGLLLRFGIDAAPLLDPAHDPLPICEAIDLWLVNELPEREDLPGQPSANPPRDMFQASDRDGEHKLFSLAADLGVFVYEALRRHDPGFYWAVDRFRPKQNMTHYNRPCLIKPMAPDQWETIFDVEMIMLSIVYEKRITIPIHRVGDKFEGLLRGVFNPPAA
jgi:hypothetical protein